MSWLDILLYIPCKIMLGFLLAWNLMDKNDWFGELLFRTKSKWISGLVWLWLIGSIFGLVITIKEIINL